MEKWRVAPFLTFNGKAEEAMQFYAANLPGATITQLVRYGKDHPMAGEGEEDLVLFGALAFLGQEILFLDMDAQHPAPEFNFSVSLYIDCKDSDEFDAVFGALAADGQVLMGPESVGHIRKCAWVIDRFGVTWQPVWE